MTKKEEMEIISRLCNEDSYFKQFMGEDEGTIVSNIKNDFAFEKDTSIGKKLNEIDNLQHELDLAIASGNTYKTTITDLETELRGKNLKIDCALNLAVRFEIPQDEMLKVFDREEIIKAKLHYGIQLTGAEQSLIATALGYTL